MSGAAMEGAAPKARAELPDHAPHILIVDDDRRLRELLSRFLSEQGFRVTTAASAAEARMRVQCFVFDAMVLDVMMPGVSGLDAIRAIRADPALADLPVILLTARAQESDVETGFDSGADDYITKPFSPRELAARVEALLSRSG